jgi:hypothetical protein
MFLCMGSALRALAHLLERRARRVICARLLCIETHSVHSRGSGNPARLASLGPRVRGDERKVRGHFNLTASVGEAKRSEPPLAARKRGPAASRLSPPYFALGDDRNCVWPIEDYGSTGIMDSGLAPIARRRRAWTRLRARPGMTRRDGVQPGDVELRAGIVLKRPPYQSAA